MTQLKSLDVCLLCRSTDVAPLLAKEGKFFVRCRGCGLIYQDPPPSTDENEAYYKEGYYEGFGERTRPIQAARRAIYQDFLSDCGRYRGTGRLLDVGCGHGDFLRMAQERGWEVWGIEPSRQAAESAGRDLGSQILNQTIETVDFPEGHFDIITLWNVLDCLPDPLSTLRQLAKWLSPSGVLVIRTPNASFHLWLYRIYSRLSPLLEKMGWRKEASVFLRTNFETKTLTRLLKETGFNAVQVKNGPLTQGDAYQVFSDSNLMRAGKFFIYHGARFAAFLTRKRVMMGSTLIALAFKEAPAPNLRSHALAARVFLKKALLHGLAVLGYLAGLPLWFRLLGKDRQIRVLRYHSVSEFRESDVNVRESEFREQLDFLVKHYSVEPLEKAVGYLEKGELPQRPTVALSFDDGTEDNYKVVYPLLQGKGLQATIFLLAGGEGATRNLPHLHDGSPRYNRLLGWEEVRQMAASGVNFGSHGMSHLRLCDLVPEKARLEIGGSKKKIESQTSRAVDFFSYPYGTAIDFDIKNKFLAKEAGYRAAFSAIFGTNSPRTDRFSLKRIGIEASDTLFTFQAKLNGALSLLVFFDLPFIRWLIRFVDSILLKPTEPQSFNEPPLLLVSVDFPPHKDGVSTISRELCARIARRGKEVLVIGPKDEGDLEFDLSQHYRVFRVSGYKWGYLRFFPILLWMPFVVLKEGVRKVLPMNIGYGGILTWALSFFIPLDYLMFAYGYEFEKVKTFPLARWVYLNIYRRARAVIACSEATRQGLIRFGVESERIKILNPAVDSEFFTPREVPREFLDKRGLSGRRILLTVGRIVERKGHDQVIRALPHILKQFPDVLYCIAGVGPYEKNLRGLIRELDLENHVRFLGKISDEELVLLYNACEIFLMPSREISEGGHMEGFGIVYLEALACAKPVIGGLSGGVSEAVRDGETGFLVDPRSPEEIRDRVLELFSHPERAEMLGQNGLRWVRKTFHWASYADKVYEWVRHDDIRG